MHPYVLISLLSTLAAGMLAAAIWARDSGNRGNQLAASLLLCAAFWSLCDVFSNFADDPATALELNRWSCLGSITIAPLAFHLLLRLEPKLELRYGRFLRFAYASGLLCAIAGVATPAMWSDVTRTSWGWAGHVGYGVAIAWLVVIPLPLAALFDWFRLPDRKGKIHSWIAIAVVIPVALATLTDFIFPYLEIHVPRLGSASLVTWGGIALWTVYRFRDPILAPHLFAREILGTLPDGVVLLRLDRTIRTANRRMEELVGTTAAGLVGRPIGEILVDHTGPRLHLRGNRECQLVVEAGDSVPVSVDESDLHDGEGNRLGTVLVIRDLREVVSLRSRLITSGRLAAVGQLAAGIAHEINNPIAYVQSNLNLLTEHWGVVQAEFAKSTPGSAVEKILEDGFEMIEESGEGLSRVAAIVRDVGGFSRPSHPEREEADLNKLLDTAARIAHPQLRHRATVERRYADLPLVPCISQELLQVFLNLLLNAAQSMEMVGTIRLVTEHDGDRVRIHVIDDGKGMSPEILERIFTPFFTTKPVGEGTGLGLSISHQIIERHGGTIEVESTLGEGTAFHIRLPVGNGGAATSAEEPGS
jgi:PAS domain S-box-containing protein